MRCFVGVWFVYKCVTLNICVVVYLENATRSQTRPQSCSPGRCLDPSELPKGFRVLSSPYLLCGHLRISLKGSKKRTVQRNDSVLLPTNKLSTTPYWYDAVLPLFSHVIPTQTQVNTSHCVVVSIFFKYNY